MSKVALRPGDYLHVVGDSSTGKSWLAGQILAEAANNPEYDKHLLIYDDIENGFADEVKGFFGPKLGKRLRSPKGTRKAPEASTTVEELFDNLDELNKAGVPFIYVVDSMDGLSSESDDEKTQENRTARKKGKEVKGTYGMAKAKENSVRLRSVVAKLKKTGSHLIIISQTRANVGFGFAEKTRSGGDALHFYAHLSIWCKNVKTHKVSINGKDHTNGHRVRFSFKKNRISGRYGSVDVDFFFRYGFDDTGACVQFLVNEKHWTKRNGKINAAELGYVESLKTLPARIEKEGQVGLLRKIVKKVWKEIEAKMELKRSPRYS